MRRSFRYAVGATLSGPNVKMSMLATSIANPDRPPVIDQTNLSGEYVSRWISPSTTVNPAS
jgi:hypothetical protein